MKTIEIKLNIKEDDIKNLLYSSDIGCNYWASSKLGYENEVEKIFNSPFAANIRNIETGGHYFLDLRKIEIGLGKMYKKEPKHFADIISGDTDNITADVFLQCCLFGEVKYS